MEKYKINKKIKKELIDLLQNVHTILNKNKITYWITGGTLLGAVRHKSIIPWDDDLDIDIVNTKENKAKIKKIKSELNKNKLDIVKTFYGYKIFKMNGSLIKRQLWREHKQKFKKMNPTIRKRAEISKYASKTYKKSKKILYEKYKYPFLDIFLMKKKDDKIVYVSNNWKQCYYLEKDIFPLKLYKFSTIKVYGAKNPQLYLDKCYGKSWKSEGLIRYDHKNEKMIKPIKFNIN